MMRQVEKAVRSNIQIQQENNKHEGSQESNISKGETLKEDCIEGYRTKQRVHQGIKSTKRVSEDFLATHTVLKWENHEMFMTNTTAKLQYV